MSAHDLFAGGLQCTSKYISCNKHGEFLLYYFYVNNSFIKGILPEKNASHTLPI